MTAHLTAGPALLHIVFGMILVAVTATMASIDWKRMVLPDSMNVTLGFVGILQSAVIGYPGLLASFAGALIAFGLLTLLGAVFRLLRGTEGLGGGDRKFVAAGGLWVGWLGIPQLLAVASVSAIAYAALRSLAGKEINRDTRIPFGPFLGFGLVVTWILTTFTAAEP